MQPFAQQLRERGVRRDGVGGALAVDGEEQAPLGARCGRWRIGGGGVHGAQCRQRAVRRQMTNAARCMNRPPAPRDLNKLLADWALLQLATVDRFDDVVRGYDRRHQQGEVNRERLAIEAAIAAKLAQEYLVQSSSAAAAAELCLTQSAISHRVRRLETHFGRRLIDRLNPGIKLTEAGTALLPEITTALDGLARLGRKPERRLRVAAGSALCTWWLASRLRSFM